MTDPLIKLYAGLTDRERAVMSFRYLMQGDNGDLERKRIESVMPEQYFVGLPLEFRRTEYNLQGLAHLYAITYWKQVAQCLTFAAGTSAMLYDPDPEAYKPVMQRFEDAEAALLAIEQAFDDTCLEHGLDAAVMRSMAGKKFYTVSMPDLKPDDVCLTGYREIFAAIMAF